MSRAETVDAEDFVRTWQTCDSVADVADRLRMSKVGASVKASHLRRAGVPLKKYRTGIGSDPAGFIEIWNASVSLEEAAVKLGIQKTSASMRAAILQSPWFDGAHPNCIIGEDRDFLRQFVEPHLERPKPLDAYSVFPEVVRPVTKRHLR